MKKISVCLVDDDDWFRDMFSQYMVHTCRNISMTSEDFRSWRDGETAKSHTDSGGFDLYLFGGAGSEFASDEKTAEVSPQSVFLYRSEAERRYLQEALPSAGFVSKYISAQNIAAHINLALSERQIGTGLVSKEGSFFVISITSSCGGAGKTSVSLMLARLLQQKRKRSVLIVSTSLLYDAGRYFETEKERQRRSLNEYLYHLFAGDEPENSLSLYIMKDRFGAASFYQPDGVSELAGLSRTEMGRFIDSLSRSELFDTLVFDLNNSNDEVTGLIADRSDVMLVLFSAEDGTEMAGRWSAHILEQCSEEPGGLWAVINKEGQDGDRLKFRDAFGEQERCGGTMKRFSIPYDPNSFYSADGARQISMTGSFAAAVDTVIKEVISFA